MLATGWAAGGEAEAAEVAEVGEVVGTAGVAGVAEVGEVEVVRGLHTSPVGLLAVQSVALRPLGQGRSQAAQWWSWTWPLLKLLLLLALKGPAGIELGRPAVS